MPAKSKAQQKFMGMVYAAKKGEKPASPEVEKAAKGMSKKSARKFAKTKRKGLPGHVKKKKAKKKKKTKKEDMDIQGIANVIADGNIFDDYYGDTIEEHCGHCHEDATGSGGVAAGGEAITDDMPMTEQGKEGSHRCKLCGGECGPDKACETKGCPNNREDVIEEDWYWDPEKQDILHSKREVIKCPECGGMVAPTRRRGYSPAYRCRKCGHRFTKKEAGALAPRRTYTTAELPDEEIPETDPEDALLDMLREVDYEDMTENKNMNMHTRLLKAAVTMNERLHPADEESLMETPLWPMYATIFDIEYKSEAIAESREDKMKRFKVLNESATGMVSRRMHRLLEVASGGRILTEDEWKKKVGATNFTEAVKMELLAPLMEQPPFAGAEEDEEEVTDADVPFGGDEDMEGAEGAEEIEDVEDVDDMEEEEETIGLEELQKLLRAIKMSADEEAMALIDSALGEEEMEGEEFEGEEGEEFEGEEGEEEIEDEEVVEEEGPGETEEEEIAVASENTIVREGLIIEKAKKKGGWPKKLKKGRFTAWAKRHGFKGPSVAAAKKAMQSDDASVRGMASFYMNTVKPKGKTASAVKSKD